MILMILMIIMFIMIMMRMMIIVICTIINLIIIIIIIIIIMIIIISSNKIINIKLPLTPPEYGVRAPAESGAGASFSQDSSNGGAVETGCSGLHYI